MNAKTSATINVVATDDEIPLTPIARYPPVTGSSYDEEGDPFLPHPISQRPLSVRGRIVELYTRNVGLLLIAAAQFFITCMGIVIKVLNSLDPPVPTLELIAVRMIITYFLSIMYMYLQSIPNPFIGPPGVRHLLVIRGVSGFFGLFGLHYSLEFLSLSDALVLTFLAPTATAIAGYLFLGEPFSRRQLAAGLISLLGVVLIARPEAIFGTTTSPSPVPGTIDGAESTATPAERGTPAQRLGAVAVALVGVFGATGAFVTLRALGKRAHPMHSVAVFSLWSFTVSTVSLTIFKVEIVYPRKWIWGLLLLAMGSFGFTAQVLMAMGLQRETASRGTLALYVQIVYAAVMERIFFHVTISALSVIGTVIILTCAIYIALTRETEVSRKTTALEEDGIAMEESALVFEIADDSEDNGNTSHSTSKQPW